MADKTTFQERTTGNIHDRDMDTAVVKTSEVVAGGVFGAIDQATGLLEGADDTAGLINGALIMTEATRNIETDNTGDGTISWTAKWGETIFSTAVTGAASEADRGKLVWVTDNNTLTLTRPTTGSPQGIIKRYISSGVADVQCFDWISARMFGYMGGDKKTVLLTSISSKALTGTSAIELITDMPMPYHGKIVDFYVVTTYKDAATTTGAQTFTLDINTTAVTGASIAWDKDDVQGGIVSSTAITAANEFNSGDTLSLKMNSGGTGATAAGNSLLSFYIEVEGLPGG